jgi:alkanesulfonate monooxygenase SsuD/methylene tetrahydromethanopterin reductase-like flavin-dependent oxidoreductase (luciferase family)
MKFGVSIFNTDYSIRMDELARALEERGFESLWLPEHTHIPKTRNSRYAAPFSGRIRDSWMHRASLYPGTEEPPSLIV